MYDSSNNSDDNGDNTTKSGTSTGSDIDAETLVNEMSDLIKDAAIWLSKSDVAAESQAVMRTRGGRGRGLPTKRFLSPSGRGRGRGGLSAKRRRVHF